MSRNPELQNLNLVPDAILSLNDSIGMFEYATNKPYKLNVSQLAAMLSPGSSGIAATPGQLLKASTTSTAVSSIVRELGSVLTIAGTVVIEGTSLSIRGIDYQWPLVDGGPNDVLVTNGAGVLTWVPVAGGGAGIPVLSQVLTSGNSAAGQRITNLLAPAAAQDAATKAYVDAYLPTLAAILTPNNSAGGIKITNLGTPTSPADASTKLYVDASIAALPAGGVTDGSKGDIVVSGSGTVWSIAAGVVTDTHLQGNISDAKLLTISTAGKVSNSATSGATVNIPSTLVLRDASGNFAAANITSNLIGLASLNLPLAGGTLTGDLIMSAATGVLLAASSAAKASIRVVPGVAPSTPVNGDLWSTSAGLFVQVNGVTVGPLAAATGGIADGNKGSITVSGAGATWTINASAVTNAMLAGSITDDKLSTITAAGKIANSATTASPANGANTIVARDGAGGASFGNVSANLLQGIVSSNASAAGGAGMRVVPGVAPTAPLDGDLWSTATGLYVRISGVTIGPLAAASGGVTDGNKGEVTVSSGGTVWTLNTISAAGKVSNSATTATTAATPNTIVLRDAGGNIAALANYLPLAGGAMAGLLSTPGSSAGGAGFRVVQGSAPSSPQNGDVWITAAGMFARANGVTSGPFGSGGGVADGNKGHITVSGAGASWTINGGVITNAMLAEQIANSSTTATTAATPNTIVLRDGSGNIPGAGGITGLTANTIPIATSATTLGDSLITFAANKFQFARSFIVNGGGVQADTASFAGDCAALTFTKNGVPILLVGVQPGFNPVFAGPAAGTVDMTTGNVGARLLKLQQLVHAMYDAMVAHGLVGP